jgi:hypothetical protein
MKAQTWLPSRIPSFQSKTEAQDFRMYSVPIDVLPHLIIFFRHCWLFKKDRFYDSTGAGGGTQVTVSTSALMRHSYYTR